MNTTTNSSGHLNYQLGPNCSYSVGLQRWHAVLDNDNCYYDASPSPENFTFTIAGQLKSKIDTPAQGSQYLATSLIPIRFNVTSDCISEEGRISNSSTSLELYSPTAEYQQCTPLYNESGSNAGYYNCTWDSAGDLVGMWGIRINASKTGYNINSTLYTNWINLTNSAPEGSNMDVTPDQGGWGSIFNYSINVSDADNDNVNCTLFVSTDAGLSWTQKGSMVVYGGHDLCWVEVSDFSCLDDMGTDNYFKFTLYDTKVQIETSNMSGPNITVDSVSITHLQGNNQNVNRTAQQITLKVSVNDTTKGQGISSVPAYFNITRDGQNYTYLYEATTASGNATHTFTPGCDFNATLQKWHVFINDTCYANTSSSAFNMTVYGRLNNSILQPTGGEYLRGSNVTIRLNVSDYYCGQLAASVLPTTINISSVSQLTSVTYPCTPIVNDGGGYYNCTFNTSLMNPRGYNINAYTSRTYFNAHNYTITYTAGQPKGFFVDTAPLLTYPKLNTTGYDGDAGENGSWSEPRKFTVNVTDEDGDVYVAVRLWKRDYTVGSGWGSWQQVGSAKSLNTEANNTLVEFNEAGNLTSPYNPDGDLGIWEYKFNVTDNPTMPKTGGTTYSYQINGSNYTVEKDDMEIHYYSGGEGNIVWRNGSDSIILSVQAWSVDQQKYIDSGEADAMVWITKDHSTFENVTAPGYLSNLGNGTINHTFFPNTGDCAYDVGVQYWIIGVENNARFKDTNSSGNENVSIWTFLNGSINSPDGEVYLKDPNINVTFNMSVWDECNEGVTSPDDVSITLTEIEGTQKYAGITSIQDLGGGEYFYNWSTENIETLGMYNMTFAMSKNYYTDLSLFRNPAFQLTSAPQLSFNVDPPLETSGEGGWGEDYDFRIAVMKSDGLPFNVSLWYKHNQSSEWTLLKMVELISEGWSNPSDFYNMQFNCTDITPANDNASYKFNASDQFGYTAELPAINFTIFKDDAAVYYDDAGSNIIINREGSSTGLFRVRINDTDRSLVGVGNNISGVFYVTTDNVNYLTTYLNSTNADSRLVLNFDPNCSHGYGPQKWKGGTFGDTCYKDVNVSERSLTVNGTLKNNIQQPNWTIGQPSFNVTDQILLRLNTTSDCSGEGMISGSSVSLYLKAPNGSVYSCTPVNSETGADAGRYNCTWNSNDKPEGNWTVNMTSTRQYFLPNTTTLTNWFWLENKNATETDLKVTPPQDGWTRLYNYTVLVNDADSDVVNCSLYINKSDGQGWLYKGSNILYNASGIVNRNCSVTVHDFTGDDIGNNSFRFLINDSEPANVHYTSTAYGPYLEEANTTVGHHAGNGSTVNISDYSEDYTTLLSVQANDTDNESFAPNANVTFWMYYNLTAMAPGYVTPTNSTGHANYDFNPDCNYSAGNWEWFAGVTDAYYEDKNTTRFNVTLLEDINVNLISPLGLEDVRGNNITIRFGLYDSCNRNITGVSGINITMSNDITGQIFNCTNIIGEGNGVYNCTFNTSANPGIMPAGSYGIEINSWKQYYNRDNTSLPFIGDSQSFYIETPPSLFSAKVNASQLGGSVGSWSEDWNFSVNVTDEDGDEVTVVLWERKYTSGSGWSSWQPVGSTSCGEGTEICNNNVVSIPVDGYTHYNGQQPTTANDTWSFKFNCTDEAGKPTEGGNQYSYEISGYNYTIERDDINITLYAGYNTTLDRNGTANLTLSVMVYDIDLGRNLTGGEAKGNVWISKNGTNLEYVTQVNVINGLFSYTFQPEDCNYKVGVQHWIIGLINYNNWFKVTNATMANITLYAPLNGTINTPNGETYPGGTYPGEYMIPIWFSVFEMDCPANYVGNLDNKSLKINPSDGDPSYPTILGSSIYDWSNGSYNYSWDSNKVKEWYNITAILGEQYYYPINVTKPNAFALSSAPQLSSPSHSISYPVGGDGGWGETHRFTVYQQDADGNNLTLYLWYRFTPSDTWILLNQTVVQGDPGQATPYFYDYSGFDCSNITPPGDNSQFKWNVTDTANFHDETDVINFTVLKDDVSVDYVSGFDLNINRDGTNSGLFVVQINDTDRNNVGVGEGVPGIFYVTTDGTNFLTTYQNDSTSDSMLSLNFDPNCSHSPGIQKWTGGVWNDTCYKDRNMTGSPREFTVYGQLKNNIQQPNWTSGQPSFNVTNQILFRFNTTSDCLVDGLVNNTGTSIYLHAPNGSNYTCSPMKNETGVNAGYYNCTWDSSDKPEGNWTLNTTSVKTYYYQNQTILTNWFWLENKNATETDLKVTPPQDGWTRLYNYTVLINDADSDTVNCSLYINKSDGQGWLYKGSNFLYNASGIVNRNCSVTVHDFTGDDIGNNSFRFLINDSEPANVHYTSVAYGPYLEEANTSVFHGYGNMSTINISDALANYTGLLSVRVNDTDNVSAAPNVNVTFWVYYNSTTIASGVVNKTNSTGHANYYFNPDCNYSAGNWQWSAGVTDNYYEDKNTTTFNVTLKEYMNINILSPLGSEHIKGSNITIRFLLNDSCGRNITGVSDINITMRSVLTGIVFNCTNPVAEGNGYYNCTFNTSQNPSPMSVRGYDMEIVSAKQYYHRQNNSISYAAGSSGFFIETAPLLEQPKLNTSGYDGNTGENGSWSEERNFTVNVTDEDGDQVTVNLFKSQYNNVSGWGAWELVDTKFFSDTNKTRVTFTEGTSVYNALVHLGVWKYKFNATDEATNPNPLGGNTYSHEISGSNYTVEKDDMSITYVSGSGGSTWRNGTDSRILSVQVTSIDQNRNLSQEEAIAVVWITKNGTNYQNVTSFESQDAYKTMEGGFVNYTLEPDCTYNVGVQYWKIGIVNNPKFKDTNVTGVYNATINAYLNGTIITPDAGVYRRASDVNVPFNLSVFDDCNRGVDGLDSTNITVKTSGDPPKSNLTITAYGNGSYFNNWSTMTIFTLGLYNMTFRATEQYYTSLYLFRENAFRLATAPEVENYAPFIDVDNDYGWGENFNFIMRCRKADSFPFNVSLWFRKNQTADWQLLETNECTSSGTTWNTSVSQEHFSDTYFSCQDITPSLGNASYKFNATDAFGFTAEAPALNFTIIRDDVNVYYDNQGSGITINREGSETGLLRVKVNDSDRGNVGVGENVSGAFFVTLDGSSYGTVHPNTTTSDSKLGIDFEPNCSHGYGTQKWRGGTWNDACYKDKNTSQEYSMTVRGQLKNNIQRPNWTSGQPSFNVTDQILLRLNATSDCPSEGAIASTDVDLYLNAPNGSVYSYTQMNNETSVPGWYNYTWDSSDMPEGNWTLVLNSSRQYFLPNTTTLTNWFWLENKNATEADLKVTPAQDGWTRLYNYTVLVNDADSDVVNCSLYINKSDGQGWIYKGSNILYNSTGIVNRNCSVAVHDFTGDDIGNNSFRFLINDSEPANVHYTSTAYGPYLEEANVTILYIAGNNSYVNISNSNPDNAISLVLRVNDTDNSSYPSGVNATIWVMFNESAWDSGNFSQTANGYINYTFDPNCSYKPGTRPWNGGTTDNYYDDRNYTGNLTIRVIGDLNNTLISPLSSMGASSQYLPRLERDNKGAAEGFVRQQHHGRRLQHNSQDDA